jgi:hypothetical protein
MGPQNPKRPPGLLGIRAGGYAVRSIGRRALRRNRPMKAPVPRARTPNRLAERQLGQRSACGDRAARCPFRRCRPVGGRSLLFSLQRFEDGDCGSQARDQPLGDLLLPLWITPACPGLDASQRQPVESSPAVGATGSAMATRRADSTGRDRTGGADEGVPGRRWARAYGRTSRTPPRRAGPDGGPRGSTAEHPEPPACALSVLAGDARMGRWT